jgi:hypothetical protein
MSKNLLLLAFAISLGATSSSALAGKPCPWNDKEQPEKSRICKAGTIQVCNDGQWVSLGIKCTAKLREDARADTAGSLRLPLVARIAPKS